MSRTLELYHLFKNNYTINPHLIPKINKVVVSMGLGADAGDKKLFDGAIKELMLITGRKPAFSRAKNSISNFKLRQGQVVGLYTTLRSRVMYEFMDRLIYLALPRIHDFRGFKKSSFDKNGNLSFGIADHLIFSELTYDTIVKPRGMNITFHVSASSVLDSINMFQNILIPVKD